MELRHLRYFLAAAQEQNLRRAAALVHVTQPALSQQIKALEDELGFALFERLPRGLRLSVAGQAYAQHVRQVLADLELARERARMAGRGDIGHLCIAFNELGGQHHVVSEGLRAFRAAYPQAGLDLAQMTTAEQMKALAAGKIDAGFLHLQGDDSGEHPSLLLDHQTFALAMPSYHPFARRRQLALKHLVGQPLLWLQRSINTGLFDGLVNEFRKQGIEPQVTLEASSDVSMLNLVSAGVGMAIVGSAERMGGLKGVVLRPLVDLTLPLRFVLTWRADSVSPTLANFIATLRSQVTGAA